MLRQWLLEEFKAAIDANDFNACRDAADIMTDGEKSYLEHYYKCISEGCNEKLADMFAASAPPQAVSDTTYLANYRDGTGKSHETVDRVRRHIAEKAGVSTDGKAYVSQLAEYPGDPRAWVNGRGDIERVCRERGMGCEGTVNLPTPGATRIPGRRRKPLAQKLHEAGLPIASEVAS